MSDWSRVRWTEAGQVNALLEDAAVAGDPAAPPAAHFDGLRESGQLTAAVWFLGQALPRLESVGWAARTVRDLEGATDEGPAARALRAALFWVQDPSEPRRWAAHDAAMAAPTGSPERLAALAAFFSGGSIAPATVAPVLPPAPATGKFVAGAVMGAAMRTGDMQGALRSALEAGDSMARHGLKGPDA